MLKKKEKTCLSTHLDRNGGKSKNQFGENRIGKFRTKFLACYRHGSVKKQIYGIF